MKNEKKRTYTKKEGLFLPARQASMLIAGALIGASLLFIGGYFVGKKHMLEQFVAHAEQDSFADQLYASMCSMYDSDMHDEPTRLVFGDEKEDQELKEELLQVDQNNPSYVAQLLSYHVRTYADTFVQKMAKKNIPLEVRTRTSVTASGDEKSWYQVVTKPFADRDELEVVVEQLSQEEKITGAQIVVC